MIAVRIFNRQYGWISLILIVIGGTILFYSGKHNEVLEVFESQGVETEARVLKTWSKSNGNPGSGQESSYYLRLEYLVDGQLWERTVGVSSTYMSYARQQGTVTVRYLPHDPSSVQADAGVMVEEKSEWLFLGGTLTAIGLYLFYNAASGAFRMLRLRNRGMSVEVEVLSHFATGAKVLDVEQIRLLWNEADGTVGYSMSGNPSRFAATPPGSMIRIYSDPKRKLPSVWSGDVDS